MTTPSDAPIDLRSDTVTAPSPEMRAAMSAAEVGDDVFQEDPTVKRLEAQAAELMGKEAAIFVPSGCMANLICVLAQAPAGSEILVAENSHIHTAEAGAYARFAQVNKWALKVDPYGRFDPAQVLNSIHVGYGRPGGNSHYPTTSLLCFENTNNFCGGTVQTPQELRAVAQAARVKAPWLKVHLDGARIFNAAVALNLPAKEIASVGDSVSFCLSKGLGAPVGSLVCGTKDLVTEAHALRKMLGGGMRQVGVLAACGLVALKESSIAKLADDHAHCKRLAEGLGALKGVELDANLAPTNILFFAYRGPKGDVSWLTRELNAAGVRCLQIGPRIRMVTHRDVSRAQIDAVLERARRILA